MDVGYPLIEQNRELCYEEDSEERIKQMLVDQGVTHGERVIVSRVPSPVDGLRLRQSGQPSAPQADASGATDE